MTFMGRRATRNSWASQPHRQDPLTEKAGLNSRRAYGGKRDGHILGGHRNRELQKDWAELGSEAFEFEILDTLTPPEPPDYDPSGDLRVLEELWLDKLSLFGERGYVLFPLSSASAYISRRKPPSYSLFGHDEWEKEAPAGWIPDLAACMQWCRPGDGAADRICADRRLS